MSTEVSRQDFQDGAANNCLEGIPSILWNGHNHTSYISLLGESRGGEEEGMIMLESSNRFPILILFEAIQSPVQFFLRRLKECV